MNFPGAGFNPAFGRDPGPPPPSAPLSGPTPTGDTGPPPPYTTRTTQSTMAAYYYPHHPYYANPQAGGPPPPMMMAAAPAPVAPAGPPAPGPGGLGSTLAVDERGHVYQYISGLNASGRYPQPPPVIDPDFPAANLINGTGGVGAEPGYNYFFPTQHAKVIVLKCGVPPWTLVPGTYGNIPFHAAKVPANITMAELLVGFGADNPDKGKNQLWEVYSQGGGRWGWREHLRGDDEVMMARSVREMGWVEKREGVLPTVYLWITKN